MHHWMKNFWVTYHELSTTHHTAMHGILSSWLGWLQNCICRNVGHSIAASLEHLVHHQNVASLSLFYRYYFVHLNWLNWFHFLIHKGGLFVFSDRLQDFSATIHRFYKGVYINSFYPCIDRPWNSLPIECFPLTYDLNCLKYRINRHLLTLGSF